MVSWGGPARLGIATRANRLILPHSYRLYTGVFSTLGTYEPTQPIPSRITIIERDDGLQYSVINFMAQLRNIF